MYEDWMKKADFMIRDEMLVKFFYDKDHNLKWEGKKDSYNRVDIEDAIYTFEYEKLFNRVRDYEDDKVEYGKLPWFIDTFFYCIFNGLIPSPKDFINKYLRLNFYNITTDTASYRSATYNIKSIAKRALNGYASLLRDFHFHYVCKDSSKFQKVLYSMKYDLDGTDIIVIKDDARYAVHLFTSTKKANEWRKIKDKRHVFGVNDVDLTINFRNCSKCGDIFLYNDHYIEELLKKLE